MCIYLPLFCTTASCGWEGEKEGTFFILLFLLLFLLFFQGKKDTTVTLQPSPAEQTDRQTDKPTDRQIDGLAERTDGYLHFYIASVCLSTSLSRLKQRILLATTIVYYI